MPYQAPEDLTSGSGFYSAQFAAKFAVAKTAEQRKKTPLANIENLGREASRRGYKMVQVHTWDDMLIDIRLAAESQSYMDDWLAALAKHGGTRLSDFGCHCQTQMMAVHKSTVHKFGGFAPPTVTTDVQRVEWVYDQVRLNARATQRAKCNQAIAMFSGEFIWSLWLYAFPARPQGLTAMGFKELGRRWTPAFNILDEYGVDGAFEPHLQEDLNSGETFERLKEASGNHPRCRLLLDVSHKKLMGVDELAYIRTYAEEFSMHHVKDAEDVPDERGAQSLFSYEDWGKRRAKYRSLGYGQIRFREYFAYLRSLGIKLPAIYEWEDPLMDDDQALDEGAPFIQALIDDTPLPGRNPIRPPKRAFDDFVGVGTTDAQLREILGIGEAPIDWNEVAESRPQLIER